MKEHLVLLAGRAEALNLRCHCGVVASRFARCRCGAVVARCGSHGDNMQRERIAHCGGT